jgi:hypothetical protein
MTATSLAEATPDSAIAFGNLIDLARLQTGTTSAEICEACSTINMGSAQFCKCCSHKLPAFYAARNSGERANNCRSRSRRAASQSGHGPWTSWRSGS